MASTIALVLGLASALLAFLAAYFWFKASAVQPIPTWGLDKAATPIDEPVDPLRAMSGWILGTTKAFQESGRLNKRAALWSAAAALVGAFAVLANLISDYGAR